VTTQAKKQTRRPTLKFFLFRRVREFVIVVEDGRRLKRVTNMKWVVEDLTAVGKRI